jgi:hypothetical protein
MSTGTGYSKSICIGLASVGAQRVIDVVVAQLDCGTMVYAEDAQKFDASLDHALSDPSPGVIVSEWYHDLVYAGVSSEQSEIILAKLVKLSRDESKIVLVICPFGPGATIIEAADESEHIKIVDGNMTPMQLLRSFGV